MNKMNKTLLQLTLLLSMAGSAGNTFALQDLTSELPDAKAGECYAKVIFPARYKTEIENVVIREEAESLEIEPARFEWVKKLVRVSDAGSELIETPAQFGTERVPYQISPVSTRWVMGTVDSDIPANPQLLTMAKAGGADIDNARPGQCFDEHFTPATSRGVTEQMLVAEAVDEITVHPAEYEWVEERVLVTPASKKLKVVPAVFEQVAESIMVEEAKKVWKPGAGEIEKIDYATGETMHLVDEPAKYKNLNKQVLKEAAHTEVIDVPARYETVRVRRLISDATEHRVTIPEKYQNVTRTEQATKAAHRWHLSTDESGSAPDRTGIRICLEESPEKTGYIEKTVVVTPPSVKRVQFPAKYDIRRVQQLVSEAEEIRVPTAARTEEVRKLTSIAGQRMEWLPSLCEKDATNELVQRIQQALKTAGFSPGPIDGILGYQTRVAVEKFQTAKGLATGGLTYDTLNALDVDI